jgi:hypothetical protein
MSSQNERKFCKHLSQISFPPLSAQFSLFLLLLIIAHFNLIDEVSQACPTATTEPDKLILTLIVAFASLSVRNLIVRAVFILRIVRMWIT